LFVCYENVSEMTIQVTLKKITVKSMFLQICISNMYIYYSFFK